MTPIRFGIAGTGGMAARMAATLKSAPGVTVVAVASAVPARAAEFAKTHGIAGHGTLAQMLAMPGLDAVYVGTANARHRETIIATAETGKAVLCEKPFALNETEADEIAIIIRRSGVLFMEAICTPFLPAFTQLAAQLRTAAIGRPTHLRAEFGYPESPAQRPALFGADSGALLDRGIYPVALALLLCGPVTHVEASLRSNASGIDTDASLLLEHANGAISQIAASLTSLLSNDVSVACTGGNLSLPAPMLHAEALTTQTATPVSSGSGGSSGGLKARLRQSALLRRLRSLMPRGHHTHLPFGADPYRWEVEHFCALLRAGKTESDILPLNMSLSIQSILTAARVTAAK